jgi:hypothetical protein
MANGIEQGLMQGGGIIGGALLGKLLKKLLGKKKGEEEEDDDEKKTDEASEDLSKKNEGEGITEDEDNEDNPRGLQLEILQFTKPNRRNSFGGSAEEEYGDELSKVLRQLRRKSIGRK